MEKLIRDGIARFAAESPENVFQSATGATLTIPWSVLLLPGLDKIKCYRHAYGKAPEMVGPIYGVKETGCRLCQTKVPCESRKPTTGRTEAKGVLK